MTEDEMVGWHHQLNGHEFEQISGDSEGQGSLACCSPWGHKELDTIEQQQIRCNMVPAKQSTQTISAEKSRRGRGRSTGVRMTSQ